MTSITTTIHDIGAARRPALPTEAALQTIASAAWARGAVLTTTFREIPPADLMRALRGAWTKALGNDERTARVAAIINTIHLRLQLDGPVQVNPSSLGLLAGFAGIAAAPRKRGRK